ncbi:uncharacterized protein K452DRAFT_311673 [Aplosporella prunicola CBS 121167]|uniref:Uncharacterized protein n=1 Tax=Aplosporella prunicola CBS 121167 TaxID=1176127 RepID=A0A6A6B3D4_9PEZI|nr:uncharacterized protein K452DRAFT_311673 [Aplosporella prunicola CBS 121167]KAF2138316.1 hypothetical protein K452DRAFT_311673 [Aplosporella prunicola CBS 121167]
MATLHAENKNKNKNKQTSPLKNAPQPQKRKSKHKSRTTQQITNRLPPSRGAVRKYLPSITTPAASSTSPAPHPVRRTRATHARARAHITSWLRCAVPRRAASRSIRGTAAQSAASVASVASTASNMSNVGNVSIASNAGNKQRAVSSLAGQT